MSFLPRSRTARRRLLAVSAIAPVVIIAAGLTMYGLRGSISYFYTPAQASEAHVAAGQPIQLGGLVQPGSLVKGDDGSIRFRVTDRRRTVPVAYTGALPDLFREGQGVVAMGAFDRSGVFEATQILAKHDERYMPKAVERALKAQGEWRG